MKSYDYLIVGQGIAGSLLAYFLHHAGAGVLIVDDGNPHAASKVNMGLMNPIFGRKLKPAWMVDTLFPFAQDTYTKIGGLLGEQFYFPMNLIRFFVDARQRRLWEKRRQEAAVQPFISPTQELEAYAAYVNFPHGGVEIQGAAVVDVGRMLKRLRSWFQQKHLLLEEVFSPADLLIREDGVSWKSHRFSRVIFCEGHRARQNPYFSWLPFSPVKGETAVLRCPVLPAKKIIHKGIFLCPMWQAHFRAGSTHNHQDLSENVTEAGRAELQQKINDLLKVPYEIIDIQAGVRPTLQDNRPVMGIHPQHSRIGILNGFGSKGISQAPYFARRFCDFLLLNRPIPEEVSLTRFVTQS